MFGIKRKIRFAAFTLIVLTISATIASWLWWQEEINVPPVVVLKIGQVASAMNIQGTMDVQTPTKFHKQEHSLSCEIATLKMALQTAGINVPESELIGFLPFDQTKKENGIWGNPNKGFVGSIDGKMLVDGYGVYWDPIAKVGMRYARTEIIRNGSLTDITKHIAAGRPVIVWGNYGRQKMYNWKTSEGDPITAVNGEHTRIVTGFSGPAENPSSFSLIDPLYGPITWSKSKFLSNWSLLGNHGVVVFPYPRWIRANNDNKVWEISSDGQKRHWVRSWNTFAKRGGFNEAIIEVSPKELNKYLRGPDIIK